MKYSDKSHTEEMPNNDTSEVASALGCCSVDETNESDAIPSFIMISLSAQKC